MIVSAHSASSSVYGGSIVNRSPFVECGPSCRPHTMNRYVGIPMSERSSPNTSHGTASSKTEVWSAITTATVCCLVMAGI